MNKDIANEMGIKERTVEGVLAQAFQRLGINRTRELFPLLLKEEK